MVFWTELTEFTEFFRQEDRICRRLQDGQKEFGQNLQN